MQKKLEDGKMSPSEVMKKMKEEVETVEEAKDVAKDLRVSLKAMDLRHGVDSDKRVAGYKMSPAVRAAQKKSDELSKTVKKPQAGTLAAQKTRKAAEMMVKKAKGFTNKVDIEPKVEPGKPNA